MSFACAGLRGEILHLKDSGLLVLVTKSELDLVCIANTHVASPSVKSILFGHAQSLGLDMSKQARMFAIANQSSSSA